MPQNRYSNYDRYDWGVSKFNDFHIIIICLRDYIVHYIHMKLSDEDVLIMFVSSNGLLKFANKFCSCLDMIRDWSHLLQSTLNIQIDYDLGWRYLNNSSTIYLSHTHYLVSFWTTISNYNTYRFNWFLNKYNIRRYWNLTILCILSK